jgi:hypothetical protein
MYRRLITLSSPVQVDFAITWAKFNLKIRCFDLKSSASALLEQADRCAAAGTKAKREGQGHNGSDRGTAEGR